MDSRTQLIAMSLPIGIAVAWFSWNFLRLLTRQTRTQAESWEFEVDRRIRLRAGSSIYRWFEPLIDELAGRTTTRDPSILKDLQREIDTAPGTPPWKPEEYLASKQVESLIAGCLGGMFGLIMSIGSAAAPLVAIVCGIVGALAYQFIMAKQIGDLSRKHIRIIKQRLPFAVDLMAFMMESGASFQESLQTVVDNNRDHPLAREFGEVIREIMMGRPREEALEHFQRRLADEDIRELVFAITKGEEMGTPLSTILRTQADQMRLKRSQWIEKAAAEAQVSIVFPGMIIMVACLLIVVAPFIMGSAF